MEKIVLQKLLAMAGVGSRREAEALIKGGNVKVNGRIAQLGDRATEEDDVRLRGRKLVFTKRSVYIKLNKPKDYVCTTRSFKGEKNVLELVRIPTPLTIIGRLDKDSEGLVLLSNDGELANRMTHPRYGVEKVYVVSLGHDIAGEGNNKEAKAKAAEICEKCMSGIEIGHGEGVVKAERAKHLRGRTFEIVLRQGKKRQIRRMFRRLGCHVEKLVRVRIGPIAIGRMRQGQWMHLTGEEVRRLTGPEEAGAPSKRRVASKGRKNPKWA